MLFVYTFGLVFLIVYGAAHSYAYLVSQAEGKFGPLFRREIADVNLDMSGAVSLDDVDMSVYNQAADLINDDKMSAVKRFFDIAISFTALAILAPVLALVVIAVKLDSEGPVIYRQKRVGLGGRVFNVLKFRSMWVGAEDNGPQYAAPDDQRITKVGRVIRRFRIDEIPQIINVLRGEMSFVGPRPERPEFVQELELEIPNYHCRHLIKPGITGWAQVKYEYAASIEGARNKLRYDLYYIRNFSPALDMVILALTVRVVFFGLGSR